MSLISKLIGYTYIVYYTTFVLFCQQFCLLLHPKSRSSFPIFHLFGRFFHKRQSFFKIVLDKHPLIVYNTNVRGISAAGSAQHWQCWGQGFESPMLHQEKSLFCLSDKRDFFQLSVPCGTLSAPSVREAMLRIVKGLRAWVAHLTSHRA